MLPGLGGRTADPVVSGMVQPVLAPAPAPAYRGWMFGGPPILLCFARTFLRLRLLRLVAGAFGIGAKLLLLRLIRP